MKKEQNENNQVILNILLVLIAMLLGIVIYSIFTKDELNNQINIIKDGNTSIKYEKLVIKSKTDYNKTIEYTFEENVLKHVNIYEKFEEKEKYEKAKNSYSLQYDIEILEFNDEELSLKMEKKDFGSDTGLTYEQIYDKYLVQIIGAYEIVE